MKKFIMLFLILGCVLAFSNSSYAAEGTKAGVLLLISEQNIEGPQRGWWASEIDLSTVEAKLSAELIAEGYQVIDPSQVSGVLSTQKAFRQLNLSDEQSMELAKLTQADYVILGKAVASSGGKIADSNMRSCFANVTAKLIRVDGGKVAAYLEASGSSVHTDVISGGREALLKAADNLAIKIIKALSPEQSEGSGQETTCEEEAVSQKEPMDQEQVMSQEGGQEQ
ncbi:hypothetical protein ACFL1D_01450 [Candidatus Omnitrophota bacterium]